MKVVVHLNHAGRGASPKHVGTAVAPFPIMCPSTETTPEELSKEHIKEIITAFVQNAIRAQRAVADAIEVQFDHGYLVHQFYSERLNKRKDKYGTNKLQFARELLEALSQSVNIPLFIRISGDEFVPDGITLEDIEKILSLAEEYGVSVIHVGWGNVCDSAH
ncbi:MAG: hypothetical protein ACP5PP_07320 [Fervidobacterium sp.]